jgi:hypothetical protein
MPCSAAACRTARLVLSQLPLDQQDRSAPSLGSRLTTRAMMETTRWGGDIARRRGDTRQLTTSYVA